MQIRQHLVPSRHQKTYGGVNGRTWITVHETANTTPSANADAHARLQARGNSRNASWHYTVDSEEIVQSYPDTAQCYHSGKGRDIGNLNSIAIEICVNDGKPHPQAVANAQALVRHLMGTYNIPVERVVQHNYWSGKNCPTNLRNGGWGGFIAGLTPAPAPAPKPEPAPTPTPTNEKEKPDMHVIHANGGRYALVSGGRAIKLAAHEYQNYKAVGVTAVKLSDARFDQIVKEWK